MRADAGRVFSHGVWRAASGRLNVCLAGVTATSAVVFQSWALFAASAVSYATLVAWNLTRVGFWKRILKDVRHRPPALPDTTDLTDPAAKHFVSRLGATRSERREILQTAGDLPPRLLALLGSVSDAERRALDLVDRLEQVSGYLFDKNVHSLRADLKRVKLAADQAKEPRTRAEYGKAAYALEQELSALDQIVGSRNLLVAKLEALVGAVEMLPCQIVRLRVLEADSREQHDLDLLDVHALLSDTDLLERELCHQVEVVDATPGEPLHGDDDDGASAPIPLHRAHRLAHDRR